jgi:alkylation response protein AidB-like acyl-CoA dehydrogenase
MFKNSVAKFSKEVVSQLVREMELLAKELLGQLLISLGSFCLSEAGSGPDAFAMKTRAVLDGSHYILNGSKMWNTNSYEAEIFLVFANVDPSKGYKGINCFIVKKDMCVQISKKEKKLGIKCSSTCVSNFDMFVFQKKMY